MRIAVSLAAACVLTVFAVTGSAQLGDSSFDQIDHPAIQYMTRPARDAVAALTRRIEAGERPLSFEAGRGYLPSLLKALDVPIESQVAVFSKTSTQMNLISPRNPRVLYFNDAVAVGWIRTGFVLEIAAQDPDLGTVFYEIDQRQADRPAFRRTRACLRCHHSLYTSGVPGLLVRSNPTASDGTAMAWTKNLATDHRSPFEERWGGWWVTGKTSGLTHMGNGFAINPAIATEHAPELDSLRDKLDTSAFLSPYSDIVALMVLEHQTHLLNLLTRLNWESRAIAYEQQTRPLPPQLLPGRAQKFSVDAAVTDLVDYLLFVDEAKLPGTIQGTSGFAEQFAKRGPFDNQGRSLRQFDLERRLMRYPCSYMIYSPAFDGLPNPIREAVYKRLWEILSGAEHGEKYARLSEADRTAVVEILRETKKGLPDYFRQ
jgi:hypothetical protein